MLKIELSWNQWFHLSLLELHKLTLFDVSNVPFSFKNNDAQRKKRTARGPTDGHNWEWVETRYSKIGGIQIRLSTNPLQYTSWDEEIENSNMNDKTENDYFICWFWLAITIVCQQQNSWEQECGRVQARVRRGGQSLGLWLPGRGSIREWTGRCRMSNSPSLTSGTTPIWPISSHTKIKWEHRQRTIEKTWKLLDEVVNFSEIELPVFSDWWRFI